MIMIIIIIIIITIIIKMQNIIDPNQNTRYIKCIGRCGRMVPHYITPNTCHNCQLIETSNVPNKIKTKYERDIEKNAQKKHYLSTYVICTGLCARRVPPHITPITCKHCALYKICDGPCKGIVAKSISNEHCPNCSILRFPHVKCETEGCYTLTSMIPKCVKCLDIDNEIACENELMKIYGPINRDYAIELTISTNMLSHTGSCYSENEENEKNDHYLYLSVFESAISSCKKISAKLDSAISAENFNNSTTIDDHCVNNINFEIATQLLPDFQHTNVMEFYIKSLHLERIYYPFNCNCDEYRHISNPVVILVRIVAINTVSCLEQIHKLIYKKTDI